MQQSLAIRSEIGDRSGLCVTLFNMGHLHMQKEDQAGALSRWVEAYLIARQIGEAQILQALDQLARSFGLDGLTFWEHLASNPENRS